MSGNKNSGNTNGRQPRVRKQEFMKSATVFADSELITEMPEMPKSPWQTKRARQIWRRIAVRLIAHNLLSELDLEMLELCVRSFVQVEQDAVDGKRSTATGDLIKCYTALGLSRSGRSPRQHAVEATGIVEPGLFDDLL